jgi:hypothetical protein
MCSATFAFDEQHSHCRRRFRPVKSRQRHGLSERSWCCSHCCLLIPVDPLWNPRTRYTDPILDKVPFLGPPGCSRSHQVLETYPCRIQVLRTPDNWGMLVFELRHSNRRNPHSPGRPTLTRRRPVHSLGHLKDRPVRPGCNSSAGVAASQGRRAELRPTAPCYYHTAEDSSNLEEGPSSDMADCSKPAEAEAGDEAA